MPQSVPQYIKTLRKAMLSRCYNRNNKSYPDYGGRGIGVCERWRASVEAFYLDMGDRPTTSHTLERKDGEGDYEPNNCVWATRKTQSRNRRNNRLFTLHGKTQCLSAWAEEYGMKRSQLRKRLDCGWGLEQALTEPVKETTSLTVRLESVTREQLLYLLQKYGTWKAVSKFLGIPTMSFQRLRRGLGLVDAVPARGKRYRE